jgi:hypothetical protein
MPASLAAEATTGEPGRTLGEPFIGLDDFAGHPLLTVQGEEGQMGLPAPGIEIEGTMQAHYGITGPTAAGVPLGQGKLACRVRGITLRETP